MSSHEIAGDEIPSRCDMLSSLGDEAARNGKAWSTDQSTFDPPIVLRWALIICKPESGNYGRARAVGFGSWDPILATDHPTDEDLSAGPREIARMGRRSLAADSKVYAEKEALAPSSISSWLGVRRDWPMDHLCPKGSLIWP